MDFLLHSRNTGSRPRCLDATARITIMGEHGSGKSSLIIRWLKNMYEPLEQGVYDMYTIHVSKSSIHSFDAENENSQEMTQNRSNHSSAEITSRRMIRDNSIGSRTPVKVEILDTSPMEIGEFSEVRTIQIEQSDAFILCFDCTAPSAINDLRTYKRAIDFIKSDALILVCCTKTDLSTERLYGVEEITDLLSKLHIPPCRYFEVSAKHGINTNKLLYRTLSQIEYDKLEQRESVVKSSPAPAEDGKSKSDSVVSVSLQEESVINRQITKESKPKRREKSQQCCIIA